MTARRRRALVTGGAGFIGSHVVERLTADGFELVVIDTLRTGHRENLDSSIPLHVIDAASPEARQVVESDDWAMVLHLASRVDIPKSVADPGTDVQANILGTLNILEAVRQAPANRRPRFVFTSSGGAVYGNVSVLPTPEDTTPRPDSPYGVAKFASEMYVDYYRRAWDIDAVSLRLGNVYGPRQHPTGEAGVVAVFADSVTRGVPMTIYGDGTQTRDFVFVGDVADAIVRAATGPVQVNGFPSLNVATGRETRINDLAAGVEAVAGRRVGVRHEPERKGDVPRSVLSTGLAKSALGWTASTGLRDGLAATWEWFSGVADASARK